MTRRLIAATLVLVCVSTSAVCATIHSKLGATATVGEKYAAKFQAFIQDLEAEGSRISFMGGYRRGVCSQRHKHSCGMALDLCQLRRAHVDHRCLLPSRTKISEIAKRHGLFSGGDWCDDDYGHVEAGGSTSCRERGNHHVRSNHRTRFAHFHRRGHFQFTRYGEASSWH